MLWIVVAVVVVMGVALAWWTSGRAKPGPELQRRLDTGSADAKAQSQIRRTDASGPRSL